jgi:ubiquinone/menaquinone biosynthesis C-methylase UbiE
MESEAVVRIYEGPWWRQNPLFTALTRLSFAQEYQLIVAAAELEPHHVLLDLACGAGIYARPLAHQLSRGGVVGLDLSLPMLTYGSHLARQEGLHNLVWLQGTATALPFANSCFDRVNCCGALHLLPELPQVLAEIKRVLQPQGIFTMAVFRHGNSPFSLWFRDLRHRLVGVQSFTAASLAQLLYQAGFTTVKCHYEQGIWLMMSAS